MAFLRIQQVSNFHMFRGLKTRVLFLLFARINWCRYNFGKQIPFVSLRRDNDAIFTPYERKVLAEGV